jgi:eukaryotic-like serine/threonine-protein kinase
MDKPDDTRTDERGFAALWSSDGATRSFSPSATGTGLPADLPFLFAPGQRFGPYLIVRPLGKGGMGQVYEAEEIESGRRVAMKILSRGLGDDEERERFLREGRLAASLSHQNTVYVFGTAEVQGFPVIAMELAPGGTLKDLLGHGEPPPFAVAVDAILQVIAGLEAAAAIGILHRDIKPSNCFVHADGRVLVGDFGLSVAASSRGDDTASRGTILGTPGFASPEQLRGDALDVRSDIYSVGATLFYLLAGRAPFDDQSTTALLTRVANEPPPLLTALRPDLPRRLAVVVAKCLAKKPGDRYSGYAALAAALRPYCSTRLKPAPLVRRALAGWIDLFLVALPVTVLRTQFGLEPLSPSHLVEGVTLALAAVAVMVLYYGFFEGRLGATPGKAIFGLRVVDASNEPPGISIAMVRALAFGVPLQVTTRIMAALALGSVPHVSVKFVGASAAGVCLVVLFSIARRSNGYTALHDRATATRVVLKRGVTETRQRHDRTATDVVPPSGDARIGPYLVPASAPWPVETAVSIEGYDDRLGRRVWLDLLPPGSPALSPLRRDLGRPGRARWLGGRRNDSECWDAYEGIDGGPIHEAASSPQPWSRVRHWLEDLALELAAGLDDGSTPALHARRVWIDRDDRGRILDWTDPGTGRPSVDPEAVAPDLQSAQSLLYGASVGALLGVPPGGDPRQLKPATPLPMPARKLLLSLRDGAFQSNKALVDGVATAMAAPATFPGKRRAMQIGACALLPVLTVAVTLGAIVFNRKEVDVATVLTPVAMWETALAVGAGIFLIVAFFGMFSAFFARGGVTLRAFGAAVVNRRGEPASRFRTLWRAVITWSLVPVMLLVLKGDKTIEGLELGTMILHSLPMALFAAGAIWAILHPSRSIQDRLAGTWIVPR